MNNETKNNNQKDTFDLPPTPALAGQSTKHNKPVSKQPASQNDEDVEFVDVTELQRSIDKLASILQNSLAQQKESAGSQKALVVLQKKSLDQLVNANSFAKNFLRGILSGFGVFVGSAILVALLIYLLSIFDTAPVIGQYIVRVLDLIRPQAK